VYVDESGVTTCLQREHGRAPRGEVVEDTVRGSKFERTNVIGAKCDGRHLAVECYKHTTDSAFIENWFANSLLEVLPAGEGYTVIMDNASFHRKKELRKLARGKVRLLFLPPYSPDYNPIEKTWANLKRFLRDGIKQFESVTKGIYGYFGITVT